MLTNWKIFTVVLAVVTSTSAFAKLPTPNPLVCGKVSGFKSVAELQYMGQGHGGDTYTVNLTFISKKPAVKQLDAALRDCLAVAVKKDGSKDILATAWYRKSEGANPLDDDLLNPYGAMNYISYVASTKNVEVRSLKKVK